MWSNMPWNPWSQLAPERFKVIGMDQRSAQVAGGRSSASFAAGDGWHTFMEDQVALLDYLGIRSSLLLGSCIGPSFQLQLLHAYPERFTGAVLLQPIGKSVHTTEPSAWTGINEEATMHWFGAWADQMEDEGLAKPEELRELYEAMFEGRDFVFTVTREQLSSIQTPMLVFMGPLLALGLDLYHPSETSREIARLAPHAQLVEQWKQSPEAVWARFACVLGGEPEADRGGGLDVQGLAPS
ncbi:Arylesterase [Durusdinium trenchii]|uniref:Arylesterase n=1 Tax=Durusdinium trenchii TaxID=1381693 RepID=A0ABP0RIC9_9DINO